MPRDSNAYTETPPTNELLSTHEHAIVWALSFLFLLAFAQLMLYLLSRLGIMEKIGS